jgi:hypothetical protein
MKLGEFYWAGDSVSWLNLSYGHERVRSHAGQCPSRTLEVLQDYPYWVPGNLRKVCPVSSDTTVTRKAAVANVQSGIVLRLS